MITIANANALHIPLADQSVQCIVTSPPYFGLRDYGTAKWEGGNAECDHKERNGRNDTTPERLAERAALYGTGQQDGSKVSAIQYRDICAKCGARRIDAQIGLESAPAAYVAHIVAVMRECKRVLKDDGVLWLNLGDSYAANGVSGLSIKGESSTLVGSANHAHTAQRKTVPDGLKPKDLCGIPWRVAFALQDDGWYLRSDIIWAKPNPMPESVTDRPTKAHEYVFMLTKQARYYYDAEAIKEQSIYPDDDRKSRSDLDDKRMPTDTIAGIRPGSATYPTRNRRSVWTVATQPYSGAHFATFPPALIEPMILAGTSARGECPKCGKAWVRIFESKQYNKPGRNPANHVNADRHVNINGLKRPDNWYGGTEVTTIGWRPQCTCPPHDPIPQTVLDPFAGSGTTGAVAVKHGRKAVLLDLNTKYIDLQFERNSKIQITMQM